MLISRDMIYTCFVLLQDYTPHVLFAQFFEFLISSYFPSNIPYYSNPCSKLTNLLTNYIYPSTHMPISRDSIYKCFVLHEE